MVRGPQQTAISSKLERIDSSFSFLIANSTVLPLLMLERRTICVPPPEFAVPTIAQPSIDCGNETSGKPVPASLLATMPGDPAVTDGVAVVYSMRANIRFVYSDAGAPPSESAFFALTALTESVEVSAEFAVLAESALFAV